MNELDSEKWLKSPQSCRNGKRGGGRLKIFLGMSAGVGKTYTMLETAHKKQSEGVNLIVGNVETHGRPETAKWLENLRIIPMQTLIYKERAFQELDVDTIIRLQPQLVIVDELAHSNVPGSKHIKRWQDVIEILDNGIDVYTTINIQHIESYKDIVEGITKIKIRETVPDLMLEQANEIEFVDITPSELLKRLKEGKVYTGELSTVALQNFFQEDRLTALREMALRFTAEKVDQELHEMFISSNEGRVWKQHDKLLVAIDHESYGQYLIRATRRLAFTLHARWIVLHVDTGDRLNDVENASLAKNFALARELGAEVMTTQDADIAEAIHRVACQENISQIIIGRGHQRKIPHLLRQSLAHRLHKINDDINLLIMRHPLPVSQKTTWFKTVALVSRLLTHHIKKWRELAIKKERATEAIYAIVREISAAPTSRDLLEGIKKRLGEILQGSCEIIIQNQDGGLDYQGAPSIAQNEKEKGVVNWVYDHSQEAGWSTATLSSSQCFYMPLRGFKQTVGVIAFHPNRVQPLLPEESNFLYTVGQQLAHFLERSFAEKEELKDQFIRQIEQMHVTVLQSISHELSLPLNRIQNVIIDIKENVEFANDIKLLAKIDKIEKHSRNLLQIAENAQAMAKLSLGVMTFNRSLCDVREWIDRCCQGIGEGLSNHRLNISINAEMPKVYFDFRLMTILLRHLLYNAIKYSPPQSMIEIEADVYDGTFVLSVSDEGEGIPGEMVDLIFEKFYRLEGASSTGLGLGLAIVKAIAEIHKGTMRVRNRAERGVTFSLIIPNPSL